MHLRSQALPPPQARNILPNCVQRQPLEKIPCFPRTRKAATLQVKIASCVFSVCFKFSSGPSLQSTASVIHVQASHQLLQKQHRQQRSFALISAPIPTCCEPCPGKINASCVIKLEKSFCGLPTADGYNCRSVLPHVKPAPKVTSSSRSPGFALPSRIASSKAMMTVAAEVLPYLSTLI